jgi:hypothetical protein
MKRFHEIFGLDAFPISISSSAALYYLTYQIVVKFNPKVLYGKKAAYQK